MATKRVAGLDLPSGATGDALVFYQAVKERLETHTGDARAPMQRSVTIQDLVDAGLAKAAVKSGYATVTSSVSSSSGTSVAADSDLLDNFFLILEIAPESIKPTEQQLLVFDLGTNSYRRADIADVLGVNALDIFHVADEDPTFLVTNEGATSADDEDWQIAFTDAVGYQLLAELDDGTTKGVFTAYRASGVITSILLGNSTDATPVTAYGSITAPQVYIGGFEAMTVAGASVTAQLQINSDTLAVAEIHTHSGVGAAYAPALYFARGRGTEAAATIVQNGDYLGIIAAVGYDGVDYAQGARIDFVVGGTPGSGDMPTDIVFSTSADGGEAPIERMRIKSSGITSFTPAAVAIPSTAIASDAMAVFAQSANSSIEVMGATAASTTVGLRFVAAGTSLTSPAAIDNTTVNYIGYVGATGYDGTAWQTSSAGLFGIKPNGTWSGTSRPTKLTLETTAVGSTSRVARVTVDDTSVTSTLVLYAPAGTEGVPSISFTADPNSGFYSAANGVIGVTIDAALSASFSGSKLTLAAVSHGIEIGSTTSAGTPYVDFHSSGAAIDYDARLSETGDLSAGASTGRGWLQLQANHFTLSDGNAAIAATGRTAVIGATGTTDAAALSYRAYFAYDCYWDGVGNQWVANRTTLGRKFMLDMGYHNNSFRVRYFDGTVSSPWADSAWDNFIEATVTGSVAAQTVYIGGASASTYTRLVVGRAVGSVSAYLSGATGTNRSLIWTTGGIATANLRWNMVVTSTAESGANAGSNFGLICYDDSGTTINTPISIARATGIITYAGVQLGPNGAVGAPTWSFSGDTNTGMYSVGADDLGFSVGGTLRVDISATALTSNVQGTFTKTTTAGLFSIAMQAASPGVNWSATGQAIDTKNWDMTVSGTSLLGRIDNDAFAAQSNWLKVTRATNTVSAMEFGNAASNPTFAFLGTGAVTSGGVHIGPVGAVGAPTYTFTGDTTSGIYRVGASDVGITTGGTLRFDVSTTLITSTLPHVGPVGAVGAPTYTFTGDTTSGIYRVGASDVGITTGGVLRFDVSTTAVTSTLPYVAPLGAVGTPGFTFVGDLNNGIYSPGADQLTIVTAGAARLAIIAAGNVSINAPTSGTAFTVTGGTALAAANFITPGVVITSADGVVIENTTASTVSVTAQWSPRLRFRGHAWKSNATAADQTLDWVVEAQPVTGAAAITGGLVFSRSFNGAAYSARFSLDVNGATTLAGSTFSCDNQIISSLSGGASSPNFAFSGSTTGVHNNGATNTLCLSVNSTTILTVTTTAVTTALQLITKGYTVAGLPAGTTGAIAHVTDALAPAFLTTVVGGGAVKTLVFYNGTNWVAA